MAEKQEVLKVMVSSTIVDLPKHRQEVKDACLRQGMFPVMMEHLPASDAEAISFFIKLVDESDIYVGVFAHRYGYVPKDNNPEQISVTEMEYNRAVERKIPRLIFIIDKNHPITIDDVDQGDKATKLKAFLDRIRTDNFVNFFQSSTDLRGKVIAALSEQRLPNIEKFHYVSDLPESPEPYIAHPYTLLQTHELIGRQEELNLLTDWVAKPDSEVYKAHILSIVAIGGMGKSALTWKWFSEIAPEEMKPLAGRMWWSFYESDASFENFIIRALAYVSGRSIEEIQKIPPQDRETQLLAILDREPFLLALDGLERILIAYARMDAAYLTDSDYDRQTANFVADAYGLPKEAAQSFTGEHLVRRTADPRAGAFLKKLSNVRAARILISTRLYPFDLQRMDALPSPGCYALFLPGMSNDDALNLWRSFGVSGPRDQLLPIFNSFRNHALLIQALASEIANYRPASGDFEKWHKANPGFAPGKYPHTQDAMAHVLEYSLRGLDEVEQKVLQTIAGFRMPTHYDTLSAVLTGDGRPCRDVRELDGALAELEDRGLVGWDKRGNRYDLHPIVRGVVWSGLDGKGKEGVYTRLHAHFEAVPMIEDWQEVNSLEDLAPAMELYHTLIGMGRYDDACDIFYGRLDDATLYRLSASRQRAEMLEMLFPDGLDELPRLRKGDDQAYTLNALALAYQFSGQPGRAVPIYRRHNMIRLEMGNDNDFSIGLENLSLTLRLTGGLRESESTARRALGIFWEREDHFQEAVSLQLLGLALATRGEADKSKSALLRALRIDSTKFFEEGGDNAYLAQHAIWFGDYTEALSFSDNAWELASAEKVERDFIRAARIQGEVALGLGDLDTVQERLHHALTRARTVNLVEEELPALVALSELHRRQGDEKATREFLDDVWEFAGRGPYPLLHADALNVLAQIERDAGNKEKAIEAASKAYELAWCDGPPYAYHWGLEKARKHLKELGAPLPEMPPFDESKFDPMPEVEIDPEDEFHVGNAQEE